VSPSRARPPAGVLPFGRHRPRVDPSAFVAPGAWLIGQVTVERQASVWFGAVVRGDARPIVIGPESLVEDNVVLHGRVTLGRACVIGHGAVLHDCVVGDRAVIGSNAVVFDATVGEGSLVAVGSVVYPGTVVPPHTVFRNGAGGNQPTVAPIGDRLRRWDASWYRRLLAVYRRPVPAARRRAPGGRDGAGYRRPGREGRDGV
jgi:carbonic anhydrase/acetyltransferase-like protein (isoleucine patch superfamily)